MLTAQDNTPARNNTIRLSPLGKKSTAQQKSSDTKRYPIVNPPCLEENEIAIKITNEYIFTDSLYHTADPDNPAARTPDDGDAV
jgi:hypothetical protein